MHRNRYEFSSQPNNPIVWNQTDSISNSINDEDHNDEDVDVSRRHRLDSVRCHLDSPSHIFLCEALEVFFFEY